MHSGQQGASRLLDELSSENNKAYETLKTTSSRVLHAVECVWGPVDDASLNADPVFLMNMLELHEEVEEAKSKRDEQKLNRCLQVLKQYAQAAEGRVQHAVEQFDSGEYSDAVRNDLIHYYTQLKYFERLELYLSDFGHEL